MARGKTTLVRDGPLAVEIGRAVMLNPDERTLDLLRRRGFTGYADAPVQPLCEAFVEAANSVVEELQERLFRGETVGVETVLSTRKYEESADFVLRRRGFFWVIYVATASLEINIARVAQRVREGGHGVPAATIASRWLRSLEVLPWFVTKATHAWIFDNSDSTGGRPPSLIAEADDGRVQIYEPSAIPVLTEALRPLV